MLRFAWAIHQPMEQLSAAMCCCFGRGGYKFEYVDETAYLQHSVLDAVRFFVQHGFVVMSPSLASLPQCELEAIDKWAVSQPCTDKNLRDDAMLRYSMNDVRNLLNDDVMAIVKTMMHEGSPVHSVMAGICERYDVKQRKDKFFVDRFGGDTVLPGGCGQALHSDWPGSDWSVPAAIACSIFSRDFSPSAAPLAVVSRAHGGPSQAFRNAPISPFLAQHVQTIVAPKGSVLIRDVHVWHGGTPNFTSTPRSLPCLRIVLHSAIKKHGFKPRRVVDEDTYEALGLNDHFSYVFQQRAAAEPEPNADNIKLSSAEPNAESIM